MFAGQTASPGGDFSRPMSAYGGSTAGMAYPMQMQVGFPLIHLWVDCLLTPAALEPQHDVGHGEPLRGASHDGRQHGLSKLTLHGHVCRGVSIRRRRHARRRRCTRDIPDDAADDASADDVAGVGVHDARYEYGIPRVPLGHAAAAAAADDACSGRTERRVDTECDGRTAGQRGMNVGL